MILINLYYRQVQILLEMALAWEPRHLEKSMGNIVDVIKQGINDADVQVGLVLLIYITDC